MPTMIQAPEVASTEVAGLQPVMRQGAAPELGSFLRGVLQEVPNQIKKHQDENQAKNIALGMNDELNKVHREVSWLDKRNYEYGHQYQFVQNGQAALQKKFTEDVDSIDITDPEAANKVFDIGRQYMNSTVDNIHQSKLPTELKESLYQSTMKENAVYQQMINKKLQQLTSDAEYNTRLNMTAMLARDLQTKEFDVESLQTTVQTFKEKVADGMRNSTIQVWDEGTQRFETKVPSAAEIQKETSLRLKAAFTNTFEGLKASGTGQDLQRMQQLSEVADMLIDEDLDLSTELKGIASTYQAQVEANNDSYKSREVEQQISDWELDPSTLTADVLNRTIAAISADDSLSISARTKFINQYQGAYTSINKAILANKAVDITLYDSPSQYEAIGKTEEAWAKDWVESIQKANGGDPNKAGYEIMVKGGSGSEYSGTLVKRGSEIFFRSLLGSVNMTDAEAKNDEYYKYRQESFAQASALYRQYKQQNGSKAIDMLSGIDEKYRAAFETVMENGGTLSQVREAFKAPVQMTDSYKYYDTAKEGITAEMLNLRSGTLGGTGGRFNKNMADNLEQPYVDMVKEVLGTSKHSFVAGTKGSSPYALLSAAKSQILLDSPAGYSSTIMPSRARQAVNGYKVEGTNTPLGGQYIGKAIDAQREAIAKQYNVRPDNVIVRVDDTGQTAQFYAFKQEKDWGGLRSGEAVLANGNVNGILSGGVISMARIKKEAEGFYKQDSTRKNSSAGNTARLTATRVGEAVIVDRSSGSKRGIGVKVNGLYAEAMGGNVDLAKDWVNHMGTYESFLSQSRSVKDKNTGRVSVVHAMGVTEASMGDDKTRRMFREAAGNPQRLMDLQGGFMRSYYKNLDMPTLLARAGIPAPTSAAYPPEFKRSLLLMYDVAWHGHRGAIDKPAKGRSSLMQALNAPTYSQGLAALKNTSVYDRENPKGNHRNKWMEESLRQHYNALGRK